MRPSIINPSYSEPFPGWTDSVAAASAVFLLSGLGVIKSGRLDLNNVGDIIPVDIVSSAIIVVTAYNMNQTTLPILQVGTSHLNPLTWQMMK